MNFRLVGTRSNRDAMGARVKLRSGGLTQIREIAGGGSYLSQSDLRANFGLGPRSVAEEVVRSAPCPVLTFTSAAQLKADHLRLNSAG